MEQVDNDGSGGSVLPDLFTRALKSIVGSDTMLKPHPQIEKAHLNRHRDVQFILNLRNISRTIKKLERMVLPCGCNICMIPSA